MRNGLCFGALVLSLALGCGGPTEAPSDGGTDATIAIDAAIASDAASGTDAGATAISAPDDRWTWVDFPDSKCASGTSTGIAINPHAAATELVIYLQGGGECTTGASCWGAATSAVFLEGFGAAEFERYGVPDLPVLDRDNAENPLRSANMVFIPYCTGDLHAGSTEVDLSVGGEPRPTWFWGARDLEIFLARLVPTFPEVARIYLTGVSAGGFGTILSYDAVARAFGVRVDAVDDSGPPILAPDATRNGSLLRWGFVPPAGCESPCDSYASVYAAARALQPSSRFGFLLYAYDTTISASYHYVTPADYTAAIDEFSASLAGDPNAATFIVDDPDCDPDTHRCHVVENDPALAAATLSWSGQMWTDSPDWSSTRFTP